MYPLSEREIAIQWACFPTTLRPISYGIFLFAFYSATCRRLGYTATFACNSNTECEWNEKRFTSFFFSLLLLILFPYSSLNFYLKLGARRIVGILDSRTLQYSSSSVIHRQTISTTLNIYYSFWIWRRAAAWQIDGYCSWQRGEMKTTDPIRDYRCLDGPASARTNLLGKFCGRVYWTANRRCCYYPLNLLPLLLPPLLLPLPALPAAKTWLFSGDSSLTESISEFHLAAVPAAAALVVSPWRGWDPLWMRRRRPICSVSLWPAVPNRRTIEFNGTVYCVY